jgi:hypothetical protein
MFRTANRLSLNILICLLSLVFVSSLALAQTHKDEPKTKAGPPAGKMQKKDFKIDFQFGGVGMAEIEDGPAELGYTEFRTSVNYRGFGVGYELRNYRWSGTRDLPFAPDQEDPFNDMHTLWVGYEHNGRISQDWGYRAYGRLASAFEDDILGLPTVIVGAGLDYAISRDFIVLGGVFASYNEADQFVIPFLGLLYRPGAQEGFSGSLGFPFSRLNYNFTKNFSATLRTGFIRRTYKLSDDNPVRPDGEFRTSEFSGGLGLNYTLTENIKASIGADYLFAREITFFNDGGEAGTDFDLDNTWGAFAKLTFEF